jgi:pimeloyl-ACP methyl ester carboxylesterase
VIERRCVYPIPPKDRGDWRLKWLRPQNVWFRSADGTKIHGWYLPNTDARRLVVFCHGNGQHVADQANLIFRIQSRLNATVFAFDYRGYGRSRGKPYEGGCIADGMAAQQWLARRERVRPEDIIVMGRSLGGAVATAMASEQGARALVLENTFSSLSDTAKLLCPWFPIQWFMRNRYNSTKRIRKYQGPLFQSHGTADSIVPIELGQKLHEAAPTRLKQFFEISGNRHLDAQTPGYYVALDQFLARVESELGNVPEPISHTERQLVS